MEPLQVLIQASCGIIDISASPAVDLTSSSKPPKSREAPFLLELFRAEIAGEHNHRVCVENMHYLAPSYLPTLGTGFWRHMFKLAVVIKGLLGL